MKKIHIISIVLGMLLVFSSCNAGIQNNTETNTPDTTAEEITFGEELTFSEETTVQEQPGETNTFEVIYGVKWNIPDEVKDETSTDEMLVLKYEGTPITLSVEHENQGSSDLNLGLYLTLNCIRQTFDAEQNGVTKENNEIFEFTVPAGEKTVTKITFTPNTGVVGEDMLLVLSDMREPSYLVETRDSSVGYPGAFLGFEVNAKVIMKTDAPDSVPVATEYSGEKEAPLDSLLESLLIREDFINNTVTKIQPETAGVAIYRKNVSEIIPGDGTMILGLTLDKSEKEDFILNLNGRPGKYRVAFYVDHIAQPCFDGKSYLDTQISSYETQTELHISLDTSKLGEFHHCYVKIFSLDVNDFTNDYVIGTAGPMAFFVNQ